jgi:protein required for attachment to host cells
MPSHAWILVADSARARIFSVESATAPLKPVEQLVHPESRLHDRDINADRPGRSFDSFGAGRHATGSEVSPKEQESMRFAKTVADRLNQGRVENRFRRLTIVADPRFLGQLRDCIAPEVAKLVCSEIDKDLSKADDAAIREHLPERL